MTTMDCGNILISSNGSEINALCTNENEIQSSVSQNAAQSAENEWVINVKTKKVHTADCPYAGKIAAENKEYSDKPVSELIAQGYSKCGSCNPGD
ncbi:MAG: hypothetical protein LUG21_00165 [Clostridiales bacterium]|nr:hypothetical protein [Clostridiales bacterium]